MFLSHVMLCVMQQSFGVTRRLEAAGPRVTGGVREGIVPAPGPPPGRPRSRARRGAEPVAAHLDARQGCKPLGAPSRSVHQAGHRRVGAEVEGPEENPVLGAVSV